MDPAEVTRQFRRFLDGELSGAFLEKWLVESRALEIFLGAERYAQMMALEPLEQERAAWTALRELMGGGYPAEELEARARRTCEALVAGTVDPLEGVRTMRGLPQGLTDVWARLDRATADIPAQEHRHRWSEDSLSERLARLEALVPEIRAAARESLSRGR